MNADAIKNKVHAEIFLKPVFVFIWNSFPPESLPKKLKDITAGQEGNARPQDERDDLLWEEFLQPCPAIHAENPSHAKETAQ